MKASDGTSIPSDGSVELSMLDSIRFRLLKIQDEKATPADEYALLTEASRGVRFHALWEHELQRATRTGTHRPGRGRCKAFLREVQALIAGASEIKPIIASRGQTIL